MSPELSRETRIKLCALTMMLSSYQVREVLGWGGHPVSSELRTWQIWVSGVPEGSGRSFWKEDVLSEGGQVGCSNGGMMGLKDSWWPTGPQNSPSLLEDGS